jgi:hypothetical protein
VQNTKDWGIDDQNVRVPQSVTDIRQAIVDSFEIKNGFLKKVLEWCTYTKEQYFKRREEEALFWKNYLK